MKPTDLLNFFGYAIEVDQTKTWLLGFDPPTGNSALMVFFDEKMAEACAAVTRADGIPCTVKPFNGWKRNNIPNANNIIDAGPRGSASSQ